MVDAWKKYAFVSISKIDGSDVEFATSTETIEINEGDQGGEGLPNMAGGRIWQPSPQEDGEITLELYPIGTNPTSGDNLFQQFSGGEFTTTGNYKTPVDFGTTTSGVTRNRYKYRVAVMATEDNSVDTAADATSSGNEALRFVAEECRLTSHSVDFTGELMKVTATFTFPAFDKTGNTKNSYWEYGYGSTTLSALGSYTSS